MTIYYSATTNAFYDSQVYNVNNIPEDKVAVAESTYKNLMAQQCAGRVIVAAADGTPTTIAQTCGPCTSTKYATKTELTNGLAGKANDNAVVHKSGNETINGVKSFGGMLKATNGTVQVGADTGYSVTFNYNGNITSKQARGTYNIFFPEGNGTLALTSDINGKANDSDVVHKTGNETINGTKTFTNTPFVSGGGATTGIYLKNTAIARNEVPSTTYYSVLRTLDKNDEILGDYVVMKTDKGATNAQINIRSEDSNGNQLINAVNFSMANDNSSVSFAPSISNKVSLGTSTYKWEKVYSDDIVHTSGNETIGGDKAFSNTIFRTADITTSTVETVYKFTDTNTKPCGSIYNRMHWYNNNIYNRHQAYNATSGKDMYFEVLSANDGSGVVNTGGSVTNNKNLTTVTSATDSSYVATMGWVNNPETSTNVVHRSGDENISGNKFFTQDVNVKNSDVDIAVTPSNNLFSCFRFRGKGNVTTASIQYSQRTYGVNDICFYVFDAYSNSHGFRIRTDNILEPIENNTYSLGSSSSKWANVYASEINTKYFTYTHDSVTSYSYLPKASGTLAIQERTRASAVVENRTLLYECAGGLDLGDITLNDVYSKFNALLIVYSNDDGGGISTYYLDCAELDIRRELAGSGTFLLVDGHSWWACTGASTGFKFVHSKNNGLRIHKIYGLAKYY